MIHVVTLNPALDRTIILKKLYLNGVSRAEFTKDSLGGKGFNVIRSFLVEEEPPPFYIHSFLGGFIGEYLLSLTKKSGINTYITPIQGKTRICSVIVDGTRQDVSLINEEGPYIKEEEKDHFLESLLTNANSGDYVIFSGSLPKGLSTNFYQNAILVLEQKGVKCILDSSGKALFEGARANPWLIKVNKLEFLELIGEKEGKDHTIETFLREDSSRPNVIVTLGKDGTIAKLDKKIYKVTLPKIEAKNPTASGDIFLGALIKAIYHNVSTKEALRLASAYSISNCLSWFPTVDLEEVNQYKQRIQVEVIGG